MNLIPVFEALFARTQISIAKITAAQGAGVWAAVTQSGDPLTLTGQAEVGKTVFYDTQSGKITAEAPALKVTDIPV